MESRYIEFNESSKEPLKIDSLTLNNSKEPLKNDSLTLNNSRAGDIENRLVPIRYEYYSCVHYYL